jgi:hypothetical protein
MTKPSVYVLGGKPELDLLFLDVNGVPFTPVEMRLSIKEPGGTIITVSGSDMTLVSGGAYSYLYRPPTVGWYEYEGWGKDGTTREVAQTNGFEVIDRVY